MNLIEDLKEKYPQIDPSKIYITGLSAGGSKATLLGIKHPHVFAAVAAVSSPGVALDDQQWSTLGNKQMLSRTASNEKGVMMKLVAVKDLAHWNYKPEAALIWDFFKNYEQDTENGELIVEADSE
ncbi:esterase phb depolymerase [Trichococcus palustris]|jgi:predicted peptidase|uniref:Esterase phb depolymerase n=1 Tax=Trichococcus palustris TaxID=140314 RepID=A0A143YCE1_9LACT|nr:PHB depolymerase family esterase [Trichococcus palustris]CZQ85419.1 esterase phb depolymerase [Trichococcus palustris]SFK55862.1 Esterase PHB depolymerase [Trichococcus palustris]